MKISKIRLAGTYLYKKFIQPRSSDPDDKRREYILNVIFTGLSIISLISLAASSIHHLFGTVHQNTNSLGLISSFTITVFTLFALSRRGLYKLAAISLTGLLGIIGVMLTLSWSFELGTAQLTFVLVIVMSGIMFKAISTLIVTGVVSLLFAAIGFAQVYGYLNPYTDWFNPPLKAIDVTGYVIFLVLIGLLTWLANKEIDNSLSRARTSEAALEAERNSLELKVIERTQELEQAQLIRVMELQRLAEFGRLSSGLLHDLANPLTAASLNLEQLGVKHNPRLVNRALESLKHIERYVEAARKHLKSQGNLTTFSVRKEIKQIISMLTHRAYESGLKIELINKDNIRLYGDPVKFSQLIANLLLNAIESYDTLPGEGKRKPINIKATAQNQSVKLVVHDHGQGLEKREITRIFKPFYSTKPKEKRNMGIGLAMVEQIAKVDFKGKIKVTSSKKQGTKFTVYLHNQKKQNKNERNKQKPKVS